MSSDRATYDALNIPLSQLEWRLADQEIVT
jgi:hypothetical protein